MTNTKTTGISLLCRGVPGVPSVNRRICASGFSLRLNNKLPTALVGLNELKVRAGVTARLNSSVFSTFTERGFYRGKIAPMGVCGNGKVPLGVASTVVLRGSEDFVACNGNDVRPDSRTGRAFCSVTGNTGLYLVRPNKFLRICGHLGTRNAAVILSVD